METGITRSQAHAFGWSGLDPGALWWRKVPPREPCRTLPLGVLASGVCPPPSHVGRGLRGMWAHYASHVPTDPPAAPGASGLHPSSWAGASLPSGLCLACLCVTSTPCPWPSPWVLSMGTLAPRFCCWRSNFHAVCAQGHVRPADLPKLRCCWPPCPSSPHRPPPLCLAAVDAALATVCPRFAWTLALPVSGNEEKTSVIPEGRKPPACSSQR